MKLFLSFFCLVLFYTTSIHAAQEIKLCYEDVTVYPWIIGDNKGLAITEIKLVEKMLNLNFTLIRLPWKRCQLEAQAGKVDGLIAASFTKERTNWGVYPGNKKNGAADPELRMHKDSFLVYVRKDSNIRWENGRFLNLDKNLVGVQLGYSVGTNLKEAGYSTHSSFSTTLELLQALDSKVLNVAVLQYYPTLKELNENPALGKNIMPMKQPFKVADQYLLFTKVFFGKNRELSKKIWNAIPVARESGEYEKEKITLIGKDSLNL